MSEIALQLVMLHYHLTGEHLPRHHFSSESRSSAPPVIAIEVKGDGQPFCTKGRYINSIRVLLPIAQYLMNLLYTVCILGVVGPEINRECGNAQFWTTVESSL